MDYVFSSTNNETILVSPNNESATIDSNDGRLRDEDVGNLFGQFPSPFLLDDDMIVLQHHQQNTNNNLGNMHSNDRWKTMSADDDEQTHDQKSADCKTTTTKRVRKKRSAGKKDRHSKIHTAQGLRDRRMRLSLHIARKFFGLQDILGFDKASKTIEWLFSKSKKAIDQVTEEAAAGGQQLNNNNNNKSPPQNTTQSVSYNYKENMNMDLQEDQSAAANYLSDDDCEVDSGIDNQLDAAASNKGKQLMKIHDYIADEMKDSSRKKAAAGTTESDQQAIIREYSSSRDKARARARERTRDKRLMMINSTIQKSKQATNPAAANEEEEDDDDDFELGLFSNNINNHYMMEESSTSHPLDQYSAAAAAAGGGTRHHNHLYDQISSTQLILEQRSTDQEDHNLGSAAAAAAAGGSSSSNYYYYYSGYNNNNYYNGSYMMNKNFVNPPPAGWLNSSNTFLGFLGGGWDDDTHENSNFTENNYGGSLHVPNHLAQSSTGTGTGTGTGRGRGTGDDDNNNIIHGQNLVIPASSPSNLVQHFQTQNQRD